MTKTTFTKRNVKALIGDQNLTAWNDKRKNHNRIKVVIELSLGKMKWLESKLNEQYPEFSFTVRKGTWAMYSRGQCPVTIVRYAAK